MDYKTPEQVEKELQALLEKHKLSHKLSITQIKQWVFEERDDKNDSPLQASNAFQKRCMRYFSRVRSDDEFFTIMQTLTDAWNYFPHQVLSGKSPWQVIQKESKKHPMSQSERTMPDVVVGGQTMRWEEYEAILAEMERLQVPFKNRIETDILPNYKRYLQLKAGKKTVLKHTRVAELFFDRVLHVGFIRLDEVRSAFIQKEFPLWWQTHVMMDNLNEREVLSSLKKLFEFVSERYAIDIGQFGF
ncbi:MAG: hypothetical protein AAB691_04185 [Patescibacteria group bacterium]